MSPLNRLSTSTGISQNSIQSAHVHKSRSRRKESGRLSPGSTWTKPSFLFGRGHKGDDVNTTQHCKDTQSLGIPGQDNRNFHYPKHKNNPSAHPSDNNKGTFRSLHAKYRSQESSSKDSQSSNTVLRRTVYSRRLMPEVIFEKRQGQNKVRKGEFSERRLRGGHVVSRILSSLSEKTQIEMAPETFQRSRWKLRHRKDRKGSITAARTMEGLDETKGYRVHSRARNPIKDSGNMNPTTVCAEDRIMIRAANPRTGVISPSHTESSQDEHQRSTKQWRLKGDQWVSVDIDRPTSSKPLHATGNTSQKTQDVPPKQGQSSHVSISRQPPNGLEDRFIVNMPSAKERNPPTMTHEQIINFQNNMGKDHHEHGAIVNPEGSYNPQAAAPHNEKKLLQTPNRRPGDAYGFFSDKMDQPPHMPPDHSQSYFSPDCVGRDQVRPTLDTSWLLAKGITIQHKTRLTYNMQTDIPADSRKQGRDICNSDHEQLPSAANFKQDQRGGIGSCAQRPATGKDRRANAAFSEYEDIPMPEAANHQQIPRVAATHLPKADRDVNDRSTVPLETTAKSDNIRERESGRREKKWRQCIHYHTHYDTHHYSQKFYSTSLSPGTAQALRLRVGRSMPELFYPCWIGIRNAKVPRRFKHDVHERCKRTSSARKAHPGPRRRLRYAWVHPYAKKEPFERQRRRHAR